MLLFLRPFAIGQRMGSQHLRVETSVDLGIHT
jgi:hypothetical protein